MFCYKCGKEIPDDASFCSGCGTKQEMGRKAFSFENIHSGNVKIPLPEKRVFSEGMNILEKCKAYYFCAVAGLVLALFFLGAQMFEVTFEFMSTRVERFSMFEERAFLKFLFVVAYLLSAILMLVPLATKKKWETWNMYPAIAVPVISVVILLLIMMSAKNQMADSWMMEAVEAKATLSAGGWFFVLINVATTACAVKSALSIGEVQEKMGNEKPEDIVDSQPPYWCMNCGEEGPFEGDACPKCGMKSKRYFNL